MLERFTERSRKVVFYAQEEAQKLGEGYVSTEHLLLGLLRESDSVAMRILENMGYNAILIQDIVIEVERQLPRGNALAFQDMTLTPRAKRVIDLAYDEARFLNNNYIGTEHLLLGLIREGDGLAGRVLAKFGLDLNKARAETLVVQGVSLDLAPIVEEATAKRVVESDLKLESNTWEFDAANVETNEDANYPRVVINGLYKHSKCPDLTFRATSLRTKDQLVTLVIYPDDTKTLFAAHVALDLLNDEWELVS